MKLRIALIVVFTALSGCTTLDVRVQEPIRDSRIGIAYDVQFTPQLCQSHTGFTVFHNFDKSYALDVDLKNHISKAFAKGISSVGSSPIILEPTPDIWSDLTRSSWDGKPTLGEQAKTKILDAGAEYDLDYVLVSFRDPRPSIEDPDACQGIHIQTGGNTYGMPFFSGVASAFVFEAETGAYAGTARLRNDTYDVDFPEDSKEITDEELQYYVEIAAQYAEGSIIEFIRSTWN